MSFNCVIELYLLDFFFSKFLEFVFRQLDIRESHRCTHRRSEICLIDLQHHIGSSAEAKCVTVNSRRPEQIAIGASDAYARIYDRRMIKLTMVNSIFSSSAHIKEFKFLKKIYRLMTFH